MHIVQALVALNVGGSELVATELAEYLCARGHRVTAIAKDGPIGDRVRASGAGHLDWPIGRKRPATFRYVKRLRQWLIEAKPDVVHVHSRWPAWVCWQAIRQLPQDSRPVFLTTMHGHYSINPYSAVMAKGRKVIAVSEHIRQYTLANYPGEPADKIVTIHGGASREEFPFGHQPAPGWREAVETEFPELRGKRWLMLPGRLTQWKGHHQFIELLGRIAHDYPDVQGVFVGGGRPGSSYRKRLQKQLKKLGLTERVTFTGNQLQIRDWMASAEIIYNLSNNPPEAFGRTVLESLCIGTPLIGWDQGGAAEIMAKMFPQAAVPVGDSDQLEARTRLFLTEPPEVAQSNSFTLGESMQKHLDLYRALCNST